MEFELTKGRVLKNKNIQQSKDLYNRQFDDCNPRQSYQAPFVDHKEPLFDVNTRESDLHGDVANEILFSRTVSTLGNKENKIQAPKIEFGDALCDEKLYYPQGLSNKKMNNDKKEIRYDGMIMHDPRK